MAEMNRIFPKKRKEDETRKKIIAIVSKILLTIAWRQNEFILVFPKLTKN